MFSKILDFAFFHHIFAGTKFSKVVDFSLLIAEILIAGVVAVILPIIFVALLHHA